MKLKGTVSGMKFQETGQQKSARRRLSSLKSKMVEYSKEDVRELANEIVRNPNRIPKELDKLLNSKVPFPKLDLLGKIVGGNLEVEKAFSLFDRIVEMDRMGSYVIVAYGMSKFIDSDLDLCMNKAREYIIKGDEWYVCDIFGDRILGHSLVERFEESRSYFRKFSKDENRWIRRSVGVAVHYFAKKVRDDEKRIRILIDMLDMQVEEKNRDVVKGVGWGLKTIGKFYPEILEGYLKRTLTKKRISALMFRKAITYLPEESKKELMKLKNA